MRRLVTNPVGRGPKNPPETGGPVGLGPVGAGPEKGKPEGGFPLGNERPLCWRATPLGISARDFPKGGGPFGPKPEGAGTPLGRALLKTGVLLCCLFSTALGAISNDKSDGSAGGVPEGKAGGAPEGAKPEGGAPDGMLPVGNGGGPWPLNLLASRIGLPLG
jgi:hypothetical protein